jgi:putative sterol carrier protein
MINIEEPKDLISISLKRILSYRLSDHEYIDLIKDWDKNIQVEIEDFYPVIIKFENEKIEFHRNIEDFKPDLKIGLSLETLLDLAYRRISLLIAIVAGKLKIKGLTKIKTLLRFSKIFLDSIKEIAADPNENYYEIDKRGR